MAIERRTLLLTAAGAAAASAGCTARPRAEPADDATGILYDATRCIGCETCVGACKEAGGQPPDWDTDGIHDDARDLSPSARTVIKHHDNGRETSFVKVQCMHCLDPACVSVCMLGAFEKVERGIVAWDADKCIGCRYCQLACPYNIPRFEWDTAVPALSKCDLCRDRQQQGKTPACAQTCPAGALTFGPYQDMLREAHDRIRNHPARYVDKVYGETEAGGAQWLYLTAVPATALGLPDLGAEPAPELSETVQHGIYRGFIAPAALYVALGAVLIRNRKRNTQREVKE
ncbi:MAG: hydrogenase 2 operon protein HybA [Myxococcota bacterium]